MQEVSRQQAVDSAWSDKIIFFSILNFVIDAGFLNNRLSRVFTLTVFRLNLSCLTVVVFHCFTA